MDSAKFVTFQAVDGEEKKSKGKVKVLMNKKAIEKALAGYNLFCCIRDPYVRFRSIPYLSQLMAD